MAERVGCRPCRQAGAIARCTEHDRERVLLDRRAAFVGEHEAEFLMRLELSHVTGERLSDDGRQRHCAVRLLRLEIAGELNAAAAAVTPAYAYELLVDPDGATQEVDAIRREAEQLTRSESRAGARDDQRAVSRGHLSREADDVFGRQDLGDACRASHCRG